MREDELEGIDTEGFRKEVEVLFEDKERREFFMQMLASSIM